MNKVNISIVIPVFNRIHLLKKCLTHLFHCIDHENHKDVEVIIVDDYSTDNIKCLIDQLPVRFYRMKKKSGPAITRNFGIYKAKGDIVLFIDSDVLLQRDALTRIKNSFKTNKNISAVQGNYSKHPYYLNFATKYKNSLLHHNFSKYNKKFGYGIATFCVAIRKNILVELGGFNEGINHVSYEDEELGMRMYAKGKDIIFDSSIQVQHLKKFTLTKLLMYDFKNGFDQTKLILKMKSMKINKVLGSHLRIRYLFTLLTSNLILLNTILIFFLKVPWVKTSFFVLLILYTLSSLDLYNNFLRKDGIIFTINSFIYSFFYNFIIILAVLYGSFDYIIKGK